MQTLRARGTLSLLLTVLTHDDVPPLHDHLVDRRHKALLVVLVAQHDDILVYALLLEVLFGSKRSVAGYLLLLHLVLANSQIVHGLNKAWRFEV